MNVAIIGVGLMGGSFALSLRDNKLADKIFGVDKSQTNTNTALEMGLIDEIVVIEDLSSREYVDLIVLTIPVDVIPTIVIKLLNKIASVGTDKLDASIYNVGENVENPEGIMVRTASMHDMEFGSELKAIARAGAGVNNIPLDKCTQEGIVVFNTPGVNANGVKELVLCSLILSSRNIVDGVNWTKTLSEDIAKSVESGKKQFVGKEIKGKTLGIIGLGAIGGMVANTAVHLGMDIVGCDPFLSVQGAWNLNHHVKMALAYEEIYKMADYITLHVPATPDTKGMINAETLAQMKDGVTILNFSRGDLVDNDAMKAALKSGKVSKYVSDFPCEDMQGVEGVISVPHLGASTAESEDNCAVMAVKEMDDYLMNGNITNSVNMPRVTMNRSGACRICIIHKNIPAILSQVTMLLSTAGENIENMTNKSRGDVAYTMIDVSSTLSDDTVSKLNEIEDVIKLRIV